MQNSFALHEFLPCIKTYPLFGCFLGVAVCLRYCYVMPVQNIFRPTNLMDSHNILLYYRIEFEWTIESFIVYYSGEKVVQYFGGDFYSW